MSWQASRYVRMLRGRTTATEKLVLFALSTYHSTEEKCAWPSIKTLSEDCEMTLRAVQQIIARLEKKGLLEKALGGGRGKVNGYRFREMGDGKPAPQTLNGCAMNIDSPNSPYLNPAPGRNKPRTQMQSNKEKKGIEPIKHMEISKPGFISKNLLSRNERERREGLTSARNRRLRKFSTHPVESWEEPLTAKEIAEEEARCKKPAVGTVLSSWHTSASESIRS